LRKACEGLSLSELDLFLTGKEHLEVPVYAIWGNQEDVQVLKKFSDGSYYVPNLYLLNPNSSFTISLGMHSLRLFGIGGAFLYHRLFDTGQGLPMATGAEGVMWATIIQLGNLIELSERYKDPNEIRVLVSHVCPGKEGLVNILATAVKADFTVSGALHGKFTHTYTDFSVRTLNNYLDHLGLARQEIPRIWEHVESTVGARNIRECDRKAIELMMGAVRFVPRSELELKHTWHLNLPDVKHGHLVLRMHDDELKLEPVVNHGWHLSLAKETRARRNSSVKPEHIASVKTDHIFAPIVQAVAPAAEKPRPVEPSASTPQISKNAAPITFTAGPYILRVTGFAPELSQAEIERMYGFKHFKTVSTSYKPGEARLVLEEEREFLRIQKSVRSMKFEGKELTVEIVCDRNASSSANGVQELSRQSISPPSSALPTSPIEPSWSEEAPPKVAPQEKTSPSLVFGQRRPLPPTTKASNDLIIEGLNWG